MPKRKHNESSSSTSTKEQSGKHAKILVKAATKDQQSPFLVAFPGTTPTSEAKFTCYRSSQDAEDISRQAIVGETEKILFSGSTFGQNAPANHCKYLVGVYSKKDKTVTFTPAPVVRLRRTVKALQTLDSDARTGKSYAEARRALGMAFGTAKAQKALKDEERNVVRGEAVEDALQDLHQAIGQTSMPTTDEIKQEMKSSLPIPAHNLEAETPEEAYDISSVVTDDELQKILVKDLLNQSKPDDIKGYLPFRSSKFVNDRVIRIVKASGKKDRNKLRMLIYIAYLMAYLIKCPARDVKNRRKVETALGNPSSLIIDKLTERYTDQGVRTSTMTDKILCYLMVLCLSVNNYIVYPEILAKDLSLRLTKVETVLRNLGCKLDKCTAEERALQGLEKKDSKKARLVVPLKFPEVSRGMRK